MRVETSRFGTIDLLEDRVVTLPEGLIGFPDCKRYVLLEHKKGSPFLWLQSVEKGSLAFVLVDPSLFKPDYEIQIDAEDMRTLELKEAPDGIQTLVIVNITPGNPAEITANLLGPIVLNVKKKIAKQIILPEGQYSIRHPIPSAELK